MLHTWLLICLATTPPGNCDFDTSVIWFQTADEPSKVQFYSPPIEKVVRLTTHGAYVKILQLPIGRSFGTGTAFMFPCDHGPQESGSEDPQTQELDRKMIAKSRGCLR